METTFKYQDKIISTPNLEKKLKRLKLTLEDIEIISKPKKIKKIEEEKFSGWNFIYRDPFDNSLYCLYENNPSKLLWNGKTGVKGFTLEVLNRLIREK